MKRVLKNILLSFCYWLSQGVVEIIVITLLSYLGLKVLSDFSSSNLVIENIQFIAWIVAYKTIMFALIYVVLFTIIYTLGQPKIKGSIVNLIISLIWFAIMATDNFYEALPILISTITSSVIIFFITKAFAQKKIHTTKL